MLDVLNITQIVLMGLAVNIKDQAGNIVQDSDKKVEIMQNIGLTGNHFSQLVEDISSLTAWQEAEENDFLQR